MSRSFLPAVALIAGLGLVSLAAPRAVGGFAELPARPVVAALRTGEKIAAHQLAIAVEAQATAIGWVDDGRGRTALGLLRYEQGRQNDFAGADGTARLNQAIAAHRRGLRRAPAQAYAWVRLAHAELLRHGPRRGLGPLLELAVASAPFDRRLVFRRLELGFLAWRRLDPQARVLVGRDARFAAGFSPRRLAALAKRRYAAAIVRAVLVDAPHLRQAFDDALRQL
ncbi:MAG: hypothetical protein ACE5H8_02465 [Alphaproteobacteria bacterium]